MQFSEVTHPCMVASTPFSQSLVVSVLLLTDLPLPNLFIKQRLKIPLVGMFVTRKNIFIPMGLSGCVVDSVCGSLKVYIS